MKIRDIIANFVEPKDSTWNNANWNDLCGMQDSDDYAYDQFTGAVKEYHVVSWICSDTRVGLSLITLHGEVVAMAFKDARKAHKQVDYVSKDAFDRLKAFMQSCLSPDVAGDNYDLLDMDQDVAFPTSMNGQEVEVTNLKVVE